MPIGDSAQFEGSPAGWPPLTRRTGALYLLVVVPSLAIMLAGDDIPIPVRGVILHLPLFVPVMAAIGICELWRLATFRSTVYSVIHGRTLVVRRGVLRVKMEEVHSLLPGFELRGGDPALMTEFGWIVLEGLGPDARDGVLGALGLPPLAEPPPPARSRRRLQVAAVVTLVLLVAAHLDGVAGAAARRQFLVVDARVGTAIFAAESSFVTGQEFMVDRQGVGHGVSRGILSTRRSTWEVRIVHTEDPSRVVASFEVECVLPWRGLSWGAPRVTVFEAESAPSNAWFRKELEAAFEAQGIQATWAGQ
ncbi:MAG TPA: hypothetical protein VFF73_36740 [Planctomycetota bacterium]|nr:hypothetical protein [Planctomycetota bacterium]